MPREAIQPDGVARPKAPYSPVVASGDLVYTAGQVAYDADGNLVPGGLREQSRRVLENLEACLAAAGCGLEDVIKVNAYVTDLSEFALFNEVYAEFFEPPYPARTTVGAQLAPGLLVEVEAVARRPGS
jgi:2-iminobutanoate/2-iminopropanoate deaminase